MLKESFRSFAILFNQAAEKGLLLLVACIIAMIMANSHMREAYNHFVHLPLGSVAGHSIKLEHLVNDCLMVLFFLLVGLEIKREMIDGNLSSWGQRILPVVAAVGGVVGPVLIYIAFNYGDPVALRGWAVPAATDIAFALGMFALFGKGLPVALRVFLAALAIVDDLIAVILIAVFYSNSISLLYLAGAACVAIVLYMMCRAKYSKILPYAVCGVLLWYFTVLSGVHATVAGVVLGMMIPLWDKRKGVSLIHVLEKKLSPVVLYAILPLFAFVNSGVSVVGMSMHGMLNTITLGIALGLFFGKQIGICLSMLFLRLCGVHKADSFTLPQFYAVSVLCGIGFTMSLFVGNLAFGAESDTLDAMKVGVLGGSVISTIVGGLVIACVRKSRVA